MSEQRIVGVGELRIGNDLPFVLIAGPCQIESEAHALEVAGALADLTRAAGVGLWDVVKTARRAGSLDQHIRDHAPNPLAGFGRSLPELRAVGFNGAKAWGIGAAQFRGEGGPALVALPSSSPAHTLAFERKLAAWLPLRAFLGLSPAGSGP